MTRCLARAGALLALLSGIAGLSALAQSSVTGLDDFPIHRVTLTENKLANSWKQVEQGTLVRMSPAEFDRLLGEARLGRRAMRAAPSVVEGRYRAKYQVAAGGEGSLVGTAEWSIRRPPSGSSEVMLEGLQLALRQAKWSDGEDAVLYRLPSDPNPYLHLPEGESHTLNLEWSGRGLPEPGEMQFELRVPSIPVAKLELELPNGLVPVVPQEEALLTGPFPAGPGDSLWRISFGGISRLEIVLRRATESPGVLLARVAVAQTLTRAEGTGRYEFQVESAKIGFTELTFHYDAAFIPAAVRVNNMESWSATTDGDNAPSIIVRLREPTRSAAVVISGSLKMPLASQPWVSPGVRLKSGVHRSERLNFAIGSALILRDWNPQGFRLIRSELATDQSYTLETESASPAAVNGQGERPVLQFGTRATGSWTVAQRAEWQINADGESLSVKSSVSATGVSPRTIRFPLPSDWQVERVQSGARDIDWSTSGGAARRLDVAAGPLSRGAEINILLRRTTPRSRDERISFPDLLPDGCSNRTGSLTVRAGPGVELIPSDPVPDSPALRPAGGQEFFWTMTPEPLAGWLIVRLREAGCRIDIANIVRPDRPSGAIHSDLTLTPDNGPVSDIALWTASPIVEPWEWRDDRGHWVASAVRVRDEESRPWLLSLTPSSPMASIASLAGTANTIGCRWRLKLPRGIDRPITLHSDYGPAAGGRTRVWPVPWAAKSQFQASLSLPANTPLDEIDSRWLLSGPYSSLVRTYRYGSGFNPLPQVPASAPAPEFQRLRLVTSLSAEGNYNCVFQTDVRRWTNGLLPVELPRGAHDCKVSIGGRQIALDSNATGAGALVVPVPESAGWTRIQIEYWLPSLTEPLTARMPRSPPSGPFPADAIQYVWQISPEWRLFSTDGYHLLAGSVVDSPSLPMPNWRRIGNLAGWNPTASKSLATAQQENLATAMARTYPDQTVLLDLRAVAMTGLPAVDQTNGNRAADVLRLAGLVAVQRPQGVVVTNSEQLARWNVDGNWLESWPADVRDALADAARFGQDRSGRFCTLAHWSPHTTDLGVPDVPTGWLVATDDGDSMSGPRVYRRSQVEYIAWALALAFAISSIALIRSVRAGLLLLISGCGAVACFRFVCPTLGSEVAGPVLTVSAFAALIQVFRVQRGLPSGRPPTASRVLITGSAMIAVAIGAIANADAQPPDVFQVLDTDGKVSDVLVPRAVFERMQQDRGRTPQGAVATAASYSASPDGGTVHIHARYRLFNFGEPNTAVRIPLRGVRFRLISLDGAEAREIDGDADGLRVMVSGKGTHNLDIDFAVPVATVGAEQELRFAIPEIPISKLSFELPGAVNRLRTGAWRGAVRTVVTPRATTLETDLGQSATVAIRWPGGGERVSTAQAKETTLWQVGAGAATLTSTIEYRVSGGPVSEFQIALPGDTEICRLTPIGETGIGSTSAVRIKDWSILPSDGAGPRKLRIELLHPVIGRIGFRLEMALTALASERTTLRCPRALGATFSESVVALEFQGIDEPARIDADGWVEQSAPAVVESIKASFVDAPFAAKPSRAFRAVRSDPGSISFQLRATPAGTSINETAVWWVDSARLTGTVESRWSGTGITFVEWTVSPSLAVTEVSGRNIVFWSQSGGRVLVWLERPLSEITLNWRATRVNAQGDGTTVQVPTIGHASAQTVGLIRRVRPMNGWVVVPQKAEAFREPLAPQIPGEIAWRCSVDQNLPMTLLPPPTNAVFNMRTAVDIRGERMESTHAIDLRALSRDRPYLLSVFVPTARDDDIQLTASPGMTVIEASGQKGSLRRWDIGIPKATPVDSESITVRVLSGATSAGAWRLPEVTLRFGPGQEPIISETISLESSGISLRERSGLEQLSPSQYRVVRRPFRATIVRAVGLKPGQTVQIASAVVVGNQTGRTWHYQFMCKVASTDTVALRAGTPAGTRLESVELDGEPLGLMDARNAQLTLPGDLQRRSLRLEWSSTDFATTLPELRTPVDRMDVGEVEFVVRVPPDADIAGTSVEVREQDRTDRSGAALDIPCGLFAGSPRRFRVVDGAPADLRLIPQSHDYPIWELAVASGFLLAALALILLRTTRAIPEAAACIAATAVAILGATAAALLIVPAAVIVWRIQQIIRSSVSGAAAHDRDSGTS